MLWLFLESLLALSLLVGTVVWVMKPPTKKGRGLKKTAPAEKADLQERREEVSPSEPEDKSA